MINIDALLATPGSLTGGKTYKQVLLEARALIADPDHWTQHAFARREDGEACKPTDPRACRRCLLGAVAFASNVHGIISPKLLEFFDQLREYCYPSDGSPSFKNTTQLNDYLSHDKVLEFLDFALQQFPN